MLAASRIARVKGRVIDLTTSISTIKGIRALGVPLGTKCAINASLFTKKGRVTTPNHKASPRGRVNLMCLVDVKTYGISPRKLLTTIRINTLLSTSDALIPTLEIFTSLISLANVVPTDWITCKAREFNPHALVGNKTAKVILNQFKLTPLTPTEGSKVVNNLPIKLLVIRHAT